MLNPWSKLPTIPPYILDFDKSEIDNNKTNLNENTELHFELLPEPFLGDPHAPVVLLNRNPGYSPDDITYHRQPAFIKLSRANLNHQLSDYSFYLLNPSVSAPGRVWWDKKLRSLIRDTSREIVSNNLACVEFFPYHSKKFGYHKLSLPSQEYSFYLVQQAMARNAVIILMRSRKLWLSAIPGLVNYPLLFSLRSVQNPMISPRNCPDGYTSIIKALD